MKKNIIIDGYFDLDDLITIAIASRNEKINILAITGTLPTERIDIKENCENFLGYFDTIPPIAISYSHKISNIPYISKNFCAPSLENSQKFSNDPCKLLYSTLSQSHDKITILATGNLFNIATILEEFPEVKEKIDSIIIAGGAYGGGDATPVAEFSIHQDATSASKLFESGIPLIICGLDVIHKAIFSPFEIDKFNHFKTPQSNLVYQAASQLLEKEKSHWEYGGISLFGATALSYLLFPDMFTSRECFAAIETEGKLTLGQTVIDLHSILKQKNNALLLTDINHSEIIEFCVNSFRE